MADLDLHLPAIAAGDPDAFRAWAAGAEPVLRGSLRRFARAVDAEAVLQETLLRAWQLAPRLRPDGRPDSLLRFALRAAHNLAVSEIRRKRREVPDDDGELARLLDRLAAGDPPPPDPLLRRIIQDCVELLPQKPREALEARLAWGGVEPDRSIAERLGARLNTFLQNFTRARRLLRGCLELHGVDLEEERP